MKKREENKHFSVVNNDMTYTGLLRLSPHSLIGWSDRRRTMYEMRTSDFSSKLATKGTCITAGAGSEHNILEINRKWLSTPTRDFNTEFKEFQKAFYDVYSRKRDAYVNDRYDSIAPKFNIDQKTMLDMLKQEIDKFTHEGFQTSMLFGGYNQEADDIDIYIIYPPHVTHKMPSYGTRGTGSDFGEPVISDFVEGLSQKERDDIPLTEATYHVFKSLVKATKNLGVGGKPDIVILDKNYKRNFVRRLPDRQSTLMFNITSKAISQDISEKQALRYFEAVLEDDSKVSDIAKKLSSPKDMLEKLIY